MPGASDPCVTASCCPIVSARNWTSCWRNSRRRTGDDAGVRQRRNLRRTEPAFAQHLVVVLADTRRLAGNARSAALGAEFYRQRRQAGDLAARLAKARDE